MSNPGRRKNILVVEDDGINQLYMKSILEKYYDIYSAFTALAAFPILASTQIDLILMDISLRGMTGLDLTKKLTNDDHYSHIPIIAVSGYTFTEDKKTDLEAGCIDCLAKPFEADDLLKMIEKYL
jgi:CheY-like chemotaxis protein